MKKTKILISGFMLITLTSFIIFTSCKKENANPIRQSSSGSISKADNSKLSSPTATFMPVLYAYIAECDLSGLCSGGPNPHYNSDVWEFDDSNGSSQTEWGGGQFVEKCFTTATAYNSIDGKLYICKTDPSTGLSELYYTTGGSLTFVQSLTFNNIPFYVNEMEFDDTGVLYLLRTTSDKVLYKLSGGTISTVGTMITYIHQGLYKEALAFKPGTGMYLILETSATSGTKCFLLNLNNGSLGTATTYSIPNCFTNNISAYYDNNSSQFIFIRDNGSGSATIYDQSGTAFPNTLSCRSTHDASFLN